MKTKYLTWDDLRKLYQDRTGKSAVIRTLDSVYDWATKQKDIKETKEGLILQN